MDETLHFDVYLLIGEADVRVAHEIVDSRVTVQFKNRRAPTVTNIGTLWMKHPRTIIDFGHQLIKEGIELAIQRMDSMSTMEKDEMRKEMLDASRSLIGSATMGNEWPSPVRISVSGSEEVSDA